MNPLYLAPDVIIKLGWSSPIDMWAIACILVELLAGEIPFYVRGGISQDEEDIELLATIEHVVGRCIDPNMVGIATSNAESTLGSNICQYASHGKFKFPHAVEDRVKSRKTLRELVPQNSLFSKMFLDLLLKLFTFDPDERIPPHGALENSWVCSLVVDEGTVAHLYGQRGNTGSSALPDIDQEWIGGIARAINESPRTL
ncbi:kinase-like domain-containing protein [Aspergillus arachidicola]|uniref:Kinase-like domain-containing protein n=1 Tax=Aspergillus arachidicola TaxID=656916 RepID=A0A5N6XSC6_9EURO|nr:kinase-like domain-containing protein [Aspergillus arachidicola]